MDASNKQPTVAEKFAAVWEKKNAKAARAGGVSLMALSLAACGSSSNDGDATATDATTAVTPATPDVDPVNSVVLTDGLDVAVAPENDNFFGGEGTLTSGDRISTTGYVELDLSDVDIDGQTIEASNVIIDASGGVTIEASDWTVAKVTVEDSTGDVTIEDLQDATTLLYADDVVDEDGTITYNFDAQAVDSSTDNVSLTVSEVTAAVAVTGGTIETLTVNIADVSTDAESTLADLTATGNTTLVITGGTATYDFAITGDLDTTVTTVNASDAASDLTLNMTEAARAEASVTLGTGSDQLNFGDTLDEDTIVGGAGTDEVDADFTNPGTRMPTMSEVEALDLTFDDSATMDMRNVDDVETIHVRSSDARIAIERMDNTVATINVYGVQADNHDFDYATGQDGVLAMNWDNSDVNDASIGDLTYDEMAELTLTFTGDENVTGDDIFVDVADTTNVTIANTNDGDVVFDDIELTDAVTDLTYTISDSGNLTIDDMAEGDSLENLTATVSYGDLDVGLIADTVAAANMDEWASTADNDGNITYGVADFTGATLSFISASASDDSVITYAAITAQDVDLVDVSVEEDAEVDMAGVVTADEVTEIDVDGEGTFRLDGANAITTIDEIDVSGMGDNATSVIVVDATTSDLEYNSGEGDHTITLARGDNDVNLVSGDGADSIITNATLFGTVTVSNLQTTDDIDISEGGIAANDYVAGADAIIEMDLDAGAVSTDAVVIASLAGATDLDNVADGTNILHIGTNFASNAAMVDELEAGGDFALTAGDAFDVDVNLFLVLYDDGTDSYLSVVEANNIADLADGDTFGVGSLTGNTVITFEGIADSTDITAAMLGTTFLA